MKIGHNEGCPYRAASHDKENNGLVSNQLLIGRMETETNREVARRKPPAGLGLLACTAGASDLCSVCHKTKNDSAGDKHYTVSRILFTVRGSLNSNGAALSSSNI